MPEHINHLQKLVDALKGEKEANTPAAQLRIYEAQRLADEVKTRVVQSVPQDQKK